MPTVKKKRSRRKKNSEEEGLLRFRFPTPFHKQLQEETFLTSITFEVKGKHLYSNLKKGNLQDFTVHQCSEFCKILIVRAVSFLIHRRLYGKLTHER